MLAIWKQIANGSHSCQRPSIHYTHLLATAPWTNLESVSNGAMNNFSAQNFVILCVQWRKEPSMILASAQRVSWLGRNSVCCGLTNCKWKMTSKFYWCSLFFSTFPAFLKVFLLSVLHVQYIYSPVQYSLIMQAEGGRREGLAALQRDGEPLFSLWKSQHSASLRHYVFHSRVGNSETNWQQLMRWRCSLKGLSLDEGRGFFWKPPRLSL
jgi:hypothetical protein